MLDDLTLVEDDGFGRVDTGRDIGRGDFIGPALEVLGVLPDGDRMHVDHAIDGLMGILERHEASDGAEIIAQMQVAGGFDSRKDAGSEGHEENALDSLRGLFYTDGTELETISRAA